MNGGRLRGERGAGLATGMVLLFAFTAAAVIWLARDVDRAISNRGAAQSIAFQAARSGAQHVDQDGMRNTGVVRVDAAAAHHESTQTAGRLLAAYGLTGAVTSIAVDGDRVTVTVEVLDAGRVVTGVGTARASGGNDAP